MEKEGDWLKRIIDILKKHTRSNMLTLIQKFTNIYLENNEIDRIINSVNYYKLLEVRPAF